MFCHPNLDLFIVTGGPSNFAGQLTGLEALAAGQQNGIPNGNFGISPPG